MNNNVQIRTVNNRYYSGMTLSEAKAMKLDKRTLGRDFYNLDINGDNVLSTEEIIRDRKRSAKIEMAFATFFALWGVYDLATMSRRSKGGLIFNLALDAALVIWSLTNASKINGVTNYYKELAEHQKFLNVQG